MADKKIILMGNGVRRMRFVRSAVIALVILLLWAGTALAEAKTGSGLTIDEKGIITGYSGQAQELVIPAEIGGVAVNGIGYRAFEGCSTLVSVSIPNGVTNINWYAFYNCSSLTSVFVPDSLESIGYSVFYGCGAGLRLYCNADTSGASTLTGAGIDFVDPSYPDLLLEQAAGEDESVYLVVTGYAGNGSNLYIPSKIKETPVKSIGYSAFYGCSGLTSVTLSNGLTTIEGNAFSGCTGLQGSLTIPDSVTSIGRYAFSGCIGLSGKLKIPSGVTHIDTGAFNGCSGLQSVELHDNISAIGASLLGDNSNQTVYCNAGTISAAALAECDQEFVDPGFLHFTIRQVKQEDGTCRIVICKYTGTDTSVSIPYSINGVVVGGIGDYAFEDRSDLVGSIVIPEGVTFIGEEAFISCGGLSGIVLPDHIEKVGDHAFLFCNDAVLYCRAGTKSAELLSTSYWRFTDPDYPAYELRQNKEADSGIGIEISGYLGTDTEIAIPACIRGIPVSRIGEDAFADCDKLVRVVLPETVKRIEANAFGCCYALTAVELPSGLKAIEEYAFNACIKLEKLTIPDGVEEIGKCAFDQNTVLMFGNSQVIEAYAQENMLQYIGNGKTVTYGGITSVSKMVQWAAAQYITPDMSEYERALRMYDWLCARADYDFSAYFGEGWSSKYNPYKPEGALLGGWAVCDGFADAYMLLLEEVGIEAVCVLGPDHEWNIARIDGKWYQFDPTWDEGGDGNAHNFFALSDYAMRAEGETHAGQYTHLNKVCDSWEANYYYRTGGLDAALAGIRRDIYVSLASNVSSGEIHLSWEEAPEGHYSDYTIALILNSAEDWLIEGWAEITPIDDGMYIDTTNYRFAFYRSNPPMILPSAVRVIESEAFMNTEAEQIILPESVEQIASRAFADSEALRLINLPDRLTFIADDAFAGCDGVKAVCSAGSYAYTWCEQHGIEIVLR